jgi:transcriptional regulator with XRE-family HTH domain
MASIKGVTDLGDYLREQRQHARLSLRQLAEVAGVSNPYLSQVERGLRKPSAEVLQQIAKGLRISAEVLYVRAGLLEDRGDRVEVEAAVNADPHLSERQRRVLLDIYETFRTENARHSDVPIETVVGAALAAGNATPAAPRRRRAPRTKAAPAPSAAAPSTAAPSTAAPSTAAPSTAAPRKKGSRAPAATKERPASEEGH